MTILSPLKRLLRRAIRTIARALAQLVFRLRVEGDMTQFRAMERLLIIANHESFLDGPILSLFLPVDPVFVLHTAIAENRWFKPVLAQVDYLAVDPTSPMAMKKVVKLIESGRPVVVFPEGRITVTGSLMKVYEGPAFAAARTGATVVPVRLDGPARSYFSRLSGAHPRRLFPRVVLSVQPALTLPRPDAPTARERRRQAGEALRRTMQAMIFQSQPKQSLYSGLLDAIAIHGRRRLLLEDIKQHEYSYRDILKQTLTLGKLSTRFSDEGDNIGVLLPNLAATVALIIGLTAFRRVPAMLNYTAGKEGLRQACRLATVTTIVTSRTFVETAGLGPVLAALDGVRVVYLEDLGQQIGLRGKLWLLGALCLPRLVGGRAHSEGPAVVLFTSGSETQPKGVVLSHRALLSNIAQIRAVIDFSVEDKFFNALPIFHSFGLTAGSLLPVMTGTRAFLYPNPLHYRVIPELIYDRSCTVLFGTSTFLNNYARFAHPYDFYRLRYVVAGAEKLAEAVRRLWFEKFGLRILEGYGATETAPALALNTPMAYRTGTVGQLLPGIQHRLVPVPGIGHGGLLHVSGPNLMSGYYRPDHPGVLEPPRSEMGGGWYNTGDLVEIDEDGFLRVVGRVKRFAKVAGEMVSLEVVEAIAAEASPGGQHAASTQIDPSRGESIVLFTTERGLDRERLQMAARRLGQPELAIARKIISLESLPLLGTGKVDYLTLKDMAARL